MAETNSISTMAGFHKVVYADGVKALMPESTKLQDIIKFRAGEKELGKYFSQCMETSLEGGFTFGGTTGVSGSLSAALAGESVEAAVYSYPKVLNVNLDATAAARAKGSKAAYAKATEFKMKGAVRAFAQMEEMSILYGQSKNGLGTISGTPATDGSNKVITVTDASWAPGIWAGKKNWTLDAYNSSGTKINTNAVLVIVSVSLASKTVTVSGNATDLGNLADTHVLVKAGSYSNNMQGFDSLCTATSIYGITVASYELMQVSTVAVDGPLSMNHLLKGLEQAAARGLEGEAVVVIPQNAYASLNSNESTLRRHGAEKKKLSNGSEFLEFIGSTGVLKVVPSIFCKEGEAFLFENDPTTVFRVGAHDITDRDMNGDAEWHRLESTDAHQLRMRSDQALFYGKPATLVKFTGIVTSA